MHNPTEKKPWYRILYIQVIIAVFIGIVVGYLNPGLGKSLKPLGDGFINLVKMIIAPIIFCTVVHGIASMSDLKKLGRVGIKALFYFEVVSTFALFIGLIVVNVLQPGAGFNVDPKSLNPAELQQSQSFAQKAHSLNPTEFLLNIIPSSFFNAFAGGDILQVLLVAILSGFAISFMGTRGTPILTAIDMGANVFFGIMRIVVKVAPIGAFGAMAFTVGSQGLGALKNLGYLMFCFYLTAGLFVVIVLGINRRFQRILDFSLSQLHQRRDSSGTRHQLVGNRAAGNAPENATGRVLIVDRRAGDSDRLQLQPRRHEHLYDDGSDVPRPGDQHASGPWPTTCSPVCCDAFIERSHRRDRSRFHHARCDTFGGAVCTDRVLGYPRRH